MLLYEKCASCKTDKGSLWLRPGSGALKFCSRKCEKKFVNSNNGKHCLEQMRAKDKQMTVFTELLKFEYGL